MASRMVYALACVVAAATACTSSGGTNDGGVVNCATPSIDAALSCDISPVAPADLTCAHWVGAATLLDAGAISCTGNGSEWRVGGVIDTKECDYDWTGASVADICQLPASTTGGSPFSWLHANCGTGCPLGDAGVPGPCATSADCASADYCELNGSCTGTGECWWISSVPPILPGQVCGCDNKTYTNSTAAHEARISVAYVGTCE